VALRAGGRRRGEDCSEWLMLHPRRNHGTAGEHERMISPCSTPTTFPAAPEGARLLAAIEHEDLGATITHSAAAQARMTPWRVRGRAPPWLANAEARRDRRIEGRAGKLRAGGARVTRTGIGALPTSTSPI
jgi:hypothetical protein